MPTKNQLIDENKALLDRAREAESAQYAERKRTVALEGEIITLQHEVDTIKHRLQASKIDVAYLQGYVCRVHMEEGRDPVTTGHEKVDVVIRNGEGK